MFFFGRKVVGAWVFMIWSQDFILKGSIAWSICSKNNYGISMLLLGYIVPWCSKIMRILWSVQKWGFFHDFFFMTKNCLCSKLPTKCTKYQQNLYFPLFCPIMSHYYYEKSFEKFRTSSLRIRYFHPIWCIT